MCLSPRGARSKAAVGKLADNMAPKQPTASKPRSASGKAVCSPAPAVKPATTRNRSKG